MNVIKTHINMLLIAAIVLVLVGITVVVSQNRQETQSKADFDPSVALEFADDQGNPLPKKDGYTYEVSSGRVKIRLKTQ